MKKILGISLVAVLAVSPMMAKASNAPEAGAGSATAFATTSYVNGAYNALRTHQLTKQDQLTNGTGNINSTVKKTIATGGENDAASDDYLLTEKAVYTAIENAKQAAINAASGDASAIESMIAGENEELADSFEETTIVGALNELAGDISTNASAISDNATAISEEEARAKDVESGLNTRLGTAEGKITTLEGKMTTAESTISKLDGDVNTAGSVKKQIKDAVDAAKSDLDTDVSGLDTRLTNAEGAINTINTRQISYVSSWETPTIVTTTIAQLPPVP